MINISKETHLDLYTNLDACMKFLRETTSEQWTYSQKEPYLFHIYSEIKSDKELQAVKSYLATQDLKKTKLILWSDYDISDNEFLTPYKPYIEMRVYNPQEEAKWTMLEWSKWLEATDYNHWMNSGIFRFLIPYKYGWAWIDMDAIMLRDFMPILDQEWAYVWGTNLDFENFWPIAALINIHPKSEHAHICLEEILSTEIQPMTTCLDKDLLAKVYRRKKFTIFPSGFFDTEWMVEGEKNGILLRDYITEQWFSNPLENDDWLFLDAFAWHWHNSSHKWKKIVPGSKFHKLMELTNTRLKERGIIPLSFDPFEHERLINEKSATANPSKKERFKKFIAFYARPKFILKKLTY